MKKNQGLNLYNNNLYKMIKNGSFQSLSIPMKARKITYKISLILFKWNKNDDKWFDFNYLQRFDKNKEKLN